MRLSHARKHFTELSQNDAGSAIGRSRNTIASYEGGGKVPDDSLKALAAIYGVDLSWLRMEDPKESGALPPEVMGKCLFDMEIFEKVMRAESLAELRELLPRSDTGFKTSIAIPVTSKSSFLSHREAEAKQITLDDRVRQLV